MTEQEHKQKWPKGHIVQIGGKPTLLSEEGLLGEYWRMTCCKKVAYRANGEVSLLTR